MTHAVVYSEKLNEVKIMTLEAFEKEKVNHHGHVFTDLFTGSDDDCLRFYKIHFKSLTN